MQFSKEACGNVSMFLALLSFVCFCVFCASFASPVWLEGGFQVSFGDVETTVDIELGLVWACTSTKTVVGTALPHEEKDCETLTDIDPDDVDDWRWVAAGLAIAALVAISFAMVLACCLGSRKQRDTRLRFGITFFYSLAGAVLLGTLLIVVENKKLKVQQLTVDLDYGWGFYLGAASVGLFFFSAILHVVIRWILPDRSVYVQQKQ